LDGQLFARDEERALNPMNFEDVFPEIIRRGGFDAVVGNPPYVSNDTLPDSEKVLYQTRYLTGKKFDLYQCFIERGAKILRDNGRYGMILPNTFLTGKSYTALRKYLLEHLSIFQIVDLPQGVFRGVTVDNVLFFYSKSVPSRAKVTVNLLHEKSDKSRVGERDWDDSYVLPQSELGRGDFCTINLALTPLIRGLFSRIESDKKRLGDYFDVCDGLIPYKTAKDAEASKFTAFERREGWGRLLRGKDIARYQVNWRGEYIKYGDHLWCKRKERFFKDRKVLLHAIRNKSLPRRLVGSLDYDAFYNTDNLINVIQHAETPSLEFLLGLLNSSLVNFWYKLNYPNVNINPNELRTIPIPRVDTKNHSEMVTKVAAMLDGKKQLAKARIDKDKTYYEKKCAALDRQIDRLVYNLYGLSEEEIAIVEEAVAT